MTQIFDENTTNPIESLTNVQIEITIERVFINDRKYSELIYHVVIQFVMNIVMVIKRGHLWDLEQWDLTFTADLRRKSIFSRKVKSSHDFDFFEKNQKSQNHDFDFFQKSKKVKVMTLT
jgi:hypothetical protein